MDVWTSGLEFALFSMDERRRAVDLYFSPGMTIRKAVAELGWPSEGGLAKWVRADPRYRGPGRSSYTLEAKLGAVRMVADGASLESVARGLGCTAPSVHAWKQRYDREGALGLMDGRNKDPEAATGPETGDDVAALRGEVDRLRLENAVMRETMRVLKADDPSLDPEAMSNREKTRVVDGLRYGYALAPLLDMMGLKRSTYYYERTALAAGDRYAALRGRIRSMFEAAGRIWGHRTICRRLRTEGADPLVVSEKVVLRLMREEGLVPVYVKRRRRYSSYGGEITEAPENLVGRDFHADAPNRLWLTDVTEFRLDGCKAYLSPVIDCYDGKVVSWTLSKHPGQAMANTMLEKAIATLKGGERPVIHSDRGCHYRWAAWIGICDAAGLSRSMSAKGCSPDNSAMEGFFGRLKNEFYHHRDWKGVSYNDFEKRLDAYMTGYNETRIKKSLGWLSPVQYRKSQGLAA